MRVSFGLRGRLKEDEHMLYIGADEDKKEVESWRTESEKLIFQLSSLPNSSFTNFSTPLSVATLFFNMQNFRLTPAS